MMTLGQRIQQIRNSALLSQEAFGEKLGVTRQTVSKWELDQAVPEISKIVMMSQFFHVTTDSILVENISTFDSTGEQFVCGVYKSGCCEVVETEMFALVYYSSHNDTVLGTRLYAEFDGQKRLYAVCEYNKSDKSIGYAYIAGEQSNAVCANDEDLKSKLEQVYDEQRKKNMKRTEIFYVNHGTVSMPTVKDAGIKKCLMAWRMSDSIRATEKFFRFTLCTGNTDYNFSIEPRDTNIYCGIFYDIPFDLGMLGSRQFFRIRNYKDNSEPWCQFFSDLGYECRVENVDIPTEKCELGKCVNTSEGIMWGIKRYTDDQIVLQGCGDDEYTYNRINDSRKEIFYLPDDSDVKRQPL